MKSGYGEMGRWRDGRGSDGGGSVWFVGAVNLLWELGLQAVGGWKVNRRLGRALLGFLPRVWKRVLGFDIC